MIKSANDQFERYFTEKLWEMIPAFYKNEDGSGDRPGTLRALVEILAAQAAVLRRSQDRLWEDQFIELCDDWAVPYIGDLLATRMLSADNKRGRRVDVAKTIHYRRHKGTPLVLEELISDVAGWDGKLVESFVRLARARHGLDAKPASLAGQFSGTMPGGWAELRAPFTSELTRSPFSEFYYTPDMRRPQGRNGYYGIPKLNFHLFRQNSFRAKDVTPFAADGPAAGKRYTFDPSGRDITLFNSRNVPAIQNWVDWRSACEWEVPAPIRCRLLAHAEYMITEEHIQEMLDDASLAFSVAAANELRTIIGVHFKSEEKLHLFLRTFTNSVELTDPLLFRTLLSHSLIGRCGKQVLLSNAISVSTGAPLAKVEKQYIVAANLGQWSVNKPEITLTIDAENGRFMFPYSNVAPHEVSATYHYGFAGPVGAGTYDRPQVEEIEPTRFISAGGGDITGADMLTDAVVQVSDNKTYLVKANHAGIKKFTLRAANQQRPYILLTADWLMDTAANKDAVLVLDGLWIGSPGNDQFNIILRGDFKCVVIRNCTFDPGNGNNVLNEQLLPVSLIIEGNIQKLCIRESITGPLLIRKEFNNKEVVVKEVEVTDSIMQSVAVLPATEATPVLETASALVRICRATLFGSINVHRLYATDSIIMGTAVVTDTQTGCFRFSAAPEQGNRLPHPYESFLFGNDNHHWFASKQFGKSSYATLTEVSPQSLRTGAENGFEMGVFNSLHNPVKYKGLDVKIAEYMPFGLIPNFINET